MTFGLQVKGHRERLGLTQGELAIRIGIAQSTMSRIESSANDMLTLKTMMRVARGLGGELHVEIAFAVGEEK